MRHLCVISDYASFRPVPVGSGTVKETGEPEGGALELPFRHDDVRLVGFKALQIGRRVSFRLGGRSFFLSAAVPLRRAQDSCNRARAAGVDDSNRVCAVAVSDPSGAPIQNGLITGADSQTGKKATNEDRCADIYSRPCSPWKLGRPRDQLSVLDSGLSTTSSAGRWARSWECTTAMVASAQRHMRRSTCTR